jgi:hypothetical protein
LGKILSGRSSAYYTKMCTFTPASIKAYLRQLNSFSALSDVF